MNNRQALVLREINFIKIAILLVLFIYGAIGARFDAIFLPLHAVDLLIHEAGHIFASVMGDETFTVLNGTLLQLAIPLICVIYFAYQREIYSSAVVLFWVAQNCFDIAVYMRDARLQNLPLVSFEFENSQIGHDWAFLFKQWGVLNYDANIGNAVAFAGWLLLILMLVVGVKSSIVYDPVIVGLEDLPASPMPQPAGIPADEEPLPEPNQCNVMLKHD